MLNVGMYSTGIESVSIVGRNARDKMRRSETPGGPGFDRGQVGRPCYEKSKRSPRLRSRGSIERGARGGDAIRLRTMRVLVLYKGLGPVCRWGR